MKFSLRQIEVFLETAKSENITQAAERLAMSQSAASAALKDLEERYSAPVFDRIGKRLQLNALGRSLRPYAEALLSQAVELESVLLQRDARGTIRVGATLTIGNYLMVPIVSQFKRSYPQIDVQLHVANTTEIASQLANFELDIGFLEGEFRHPDLQASVWQQDELVVFARPQHPLAQKRILLLEDLADYEWILREKGSGTRQAFDHMMYGYEDRLNIFLELEHTEAIKRAVETDDCLACLSRIALQDALATGRFVALDVDVRGKDRERRGRTRNLYQVLRKKKNIFRALQLWIDYCAGV